MSASPVVVVDDDDVVVVLVASGAASSVVDDASAAGVVVVVVVVVVELVEGEGSDDSAALFSLRTAAIAARTRGASRAEHSLMACEIIRCGYDTKKPVRDSLIIDECFLKCFLMIPR